MKDKLKSAGIRLSMMMGRYAAWTPEERRMRQAEPVWFSGDIPPMAGHEMNQYRVVYSIPRPLITHADGVMYSAEGMAWVRGCLQARYSFHEAGLKQILQKPRRPQAIFQRAGILQSQTPKTYGDWVSEHAASIARAIVTKQLVEPLLIPGHWFSKPYVQRDLNLLGVKAHGVTDPVFINNATIINKTRNSHHWTAEEAGALMTAMKIVPKPCKSGSALYLSRKGEKGEGPRREIRNDITEAAMEAAGVLVVRTAGRTREEYMALAEHAETVFADHGSASYNMMYWQTRRMVEFFTPNYWDPAFLFLFDALGRRDYHLWRIDDQTTVAGLTQRIRALLNLPAGGAPVSVARVERVTQNA